VNTLLPYYERELGHLRHYAREFAAQYPKIASRLQLSEDVSTDPHVERLIEAFAFLSARITKKLDDDFPEFTDGLLEALYPHYLRPFPSSSIALFEPAATADKSAQTTIIERGTVLFSRSVLGTACRFRSCYDVELGDARICGFRFDAADNALPAIRSQARGTAVISINIEFDDEERQTGARSPLRVFIDGEPSLRALIRDTLALSVMSAYVQAPDASAWTELTASPIRFVGFDDDESMVPFGPQSNSAYQLLTEFFCFPEKFNFFEIDLAAIGAAGISRNFSLHLLLDGPSEGTHAAQALFGISASNLRLFCTPVVNLFQQRAEPISVTEHQSSYPVIADHRRPQAYEIYSIDRVQRIRQTAQGKQISDFRPMYAVSFEDDPEAPERCWLARRDREIAQRSPGHEVELTIIEPQQDFAAARTDTLSLELTCTNRELPAQLAYGTVGGDLSTRSWNGQGRISMLRKPTNPQRFGHGGAAQWRLIAHLAANPQSVLSNGAQGLKDLLKLYDLPRSAHNNQLIEGIVDLQARATVAWLPGPYFPSVVRGIEIHLTVNESHFVGLGISTFAEIIDRFFGLYVPLNSFVELVLLSSERSEEILRCPRRSGSSILP